MRGGSCISCSLVAPCIELSPHSNPSQPTPPDDPAEYAEELVQWRRVQSSYERHDHRSENSDRDRDRSYHSLASSPPPRRPEPYACDAPREPEGFDHREQPRSEALGIVDELPTVANRVAEAAALCRVELETDVGGVVPHGGGEGVARRDSAHRAAQPQVRLLQGRAERGHMIAERQVGVIDGQHQHLGALLVEDRDEG